MTQCLYSIAARISSSDRDILRAFALADISSSSACDTDKATCLLRTVDGSLSPHRVAAPLCPPSWHIPLSVSLVSMAMIKCRKMAKAAVQTHAPTRGATFKKPPPSTASLFQSTHPRGVRQPNEKLVNASNWFQSTHPRGVRQLRPHRLSRVKCFNPRTHEGCDSSDHIDCHV